MVRDGSSLGPAGREMVTAPRPAWFPAGLLPGRAAQMVNPWGQERQDAHRAGRFEAKRA